MCEFVCVCVCVCALGVQVYPCMESIDKHRYVEVCM